MAPFLSLPAHPHPHCRLVCTQHLQTAHSVCVCAQSIPLKDTFSCVLYVHGSFPFAVPPVPFGSPSPTSSHPNFHANQPPFPVSAVRRGRRMRLLLLLLLRKERRRRLQLLLLLRPQQLRLLQRRPLLLKLVKVTMEMRMQHRLPLHRLHLPSQKRYSACSDCRAFGLSTCTAVHAGNLIDRKVRDDLSVCSCFGLLRRFSHTTIAPI